MSQQRIGEVEILRMACGEFLYFGFMDLWESVDISFAQLQIIELYPQQFLPRAVVPPPAPKGLRGEKRENTNSQSSFHLDKKELLEVRNVLWN